MRRVERVVGQLLGPVGRDWLLPSGQRLVICFSRAHHDGRDFFVGLPNRLQDEDALIVGLAEHDVVFPHAGELLQYAEWFSRSNDGRPNPRFVARDGAIFLRIPGLGIEETVAEREGNYALLRASLLATAKPASLGQPFGTRPPPTRRPVRYTVDSTGLVDATKRHEALVDALAEMVRAMRLDPLEWTFPLPPFDLGWYDGARLHIVEVKSLTDRNEESQLRLGLGQLLRYRQSVQSVTADGCVAVLCIEKRPRDSGWITLCESVDVRLIWPPDFLWPRS